MSRKKSGAEARDSATLLKFADTNGSSQAAAEQLLDQIDNLALLLHEVRRQTDRIGAAADAIGDAILNRLDTATTSIPSLPAPRGAASIHSKNSARLRTLPHRTPEITDVRP